MLRHLRDPALTVPAIVLVAVVAAARPRSEAAWLRDLGDPKRDAFERGMAALALARESRGSATAAVPQLLLTLEGNTDCLRPPAHRALLELAPVSGSVLVRCRIECRYSRPETIQALRAALDAAGESAIDELVAALARTDPRHLEFAQIRLARLGRPALPALVAATGEGTPARARVRAIELSRKIDPDGRVVLPPLRAALASPDEAVSSASAIAIAHIQLGRAAACAPGARGEILREILLLGNRALPALGHALASPDANLRECAGIVLAAAILQSFRS